MARDHPNIELSVIEALAVLTVPEVKQLVEEIETVLIHNDSPPLAS